MKVVAVHQPTFLPWLGWWDKLARADVLVLLDDVQFPKKGGTWMNRVRMLVSGMFKDAGRLLNGRVGKADFLQGSG